MTLVAQLRVVRGVDEGSRRYGVASRQSRLEVALAGYARDLRRFALERTRWAVLAGRWPTHTKSSGRALDLDRISGRARAIDGLVPRIDPGAVRGIGFGCVPTHLAVFALALARDILIGSWDTGDASDGTFHVAVRSWGTSFAPCVRARALVAFFA